jgi:protein TonB
VGESPEGNRVISTPDLDAPPEPAQDEPEAPPDEEAQLDVEPLAALVEPPIEQPASKLEPQPKSPPDVLTVETPPEALEAPPPRTPDAAQILNSRNDEIARLTASLEARTAAYASRLRRRSISASTREFRYASYLAAWARKVERIGNLNYPQAAKEQRLHGNLILHVALRKDGSVEAIRIVRSSGYDVLDQAAVNIVKLAAPYSPFPPDIAAETDVLDIIRTWQFLRGGRLGWEE